MNIIKHLAGPYVKNNERFYLEPELGENLKEFIRTYGYTLAPIGDLDEYKRFVETQLNLDREARKLVVPVEILHHLAKNPIAFELSKLTLKRRLDALGKWDVFKALLTSAGAWDDFALAQTIRTDDPLFVAQAPLLKQQLKLTDEQFAGLIAP